MKTDKPKKKEFELAIELKEFSPFYRFLYFKELLMFRSFFFFLIFELQILRKGENDRNLFILICIIVNEFTFSLVQ